MKKICFVLGLLFFTGSFIFAQEASDNKDKNEKLRENVIGTYQVQVVNSRKKPAIPYDAYKIVMEKRHPHDTVYHYLYEDIRLMILPDQVINKPDFKGVERIKHVSN